MRIGKKKEKGKPIIYKNGKLFARFRGMSRVAGGKGKPSPHTCFEIHGWDRMANGGRRGGPDGSSEPLKSGFFGVWGVHGAPPSSGRGAQRAAL